VVNQNDVDVAWEQDIAPFVDGLPPEQRAATITEFADDTKRIPTQVKNQIISNLNSLDPDLVAESASIMDRLDSVRGLPENNFPSNERAFADTVVLLSQNLDPKEAINLARKNTDPNDKARVEVRTAIIKDDEMRSDYPGIVQNSVDPFFGATRVDSINEGKLVKEYGALFEEHFKAGMSVDSAKEKSLQILKRNWGETDITGTARAIKYPPEDYYTVAGNSKYMGDQLLKDVRKDFVFDTPVKSEMLRVVSDQETARTAAQGRPTYSIIVDRGEDGLVPLMGFRWTPDVQQEVDRQTEESRQKVEIQRDPARRGQAKAQEALKGLGSF